MRQRILKITVAVLMLALLLVSMALPTGAEPPYQPYLYGVDMEWIGSANAYSVDRLLDAKAMGVEKLNSIADMRYYDGKLFILDGGISGVGASVVILDKDYNLIRHITEFVGVNGEPESFNAPEGIEVYKYKGTENAGKYDIVVCDTENHRVVRMDEFGHFVHVYDAPDISILDTDYEEAVFRPSKVAFDNTGRLFVAAKNINQGLICMDPDGTFNCFFGAPKVTADAMTKLWRKILSASGVESLLSYTPTEYSNITADEKGFVYGVIIAPSAEAYLAALESLPGEPARNSGANVVRLNAAGEDVLKRMGFATNCGDLLIIGNTEITAEQTLGAHTAFVDVALGENGIYSCLDRTFGRVFTYDEDGNLLFEFGNGGSMYEGTQVGTNRTATAIAINGQDILVADGWYNTITVYSPTDYGETVLEAASLYYQGEYEASEAVWAEVLRRNSNMAYAYIGTGKALHRKGEYTAAMACFREVDSRSYYSKSLKLYIKESFGNAFTIVFIAIILLIVGVKIYNGVKKFRAFMRDGVKKVM